MAALFRTSNVPGILQIDCGASEAFAPPSYPTFLFYNPYTLAKEIVINLGSNTNHLYDAVRGVFLTTNVSGTTTLTLQPDSAVVLVQCPATGALSQVSHKLLLGGVVIDFANGTQDTDGDSLPDWWETRYYGNITNALPQAAASNGFNNLQCYWLGLDPNDSTSTFKAQAASQPGTDYPIIRWNSVGGKTYVVEYANSLSSGTSFTVALTTVETNAAPGVQGIASFVDDYTLTAGPPGPSGRYYRIRWVAP